MSLAFWIYPRHSNDQAICDNIINWNSSAARIILTALRTGRWRQELISSSAFSTAGLVWPCISATLEDKSRSGLHWKTGGLGSTRVDSKSIIADCSSSGRVGAEMLDAACVTVGVGFPGGVKHSTSDKAV
jgi:hypothetical protein